MFHNKDFYPTPDNIIFKMSRVVDISSGYSILEPSAGSCAIIDYIRSCYRKHKIYAFEKDVELQAIVKNKKDVVFLGDDFLAYTGVKRFDRIFMNPPFSEGDKHALKAWEVLESEGQMVCLLNAETILNPYTSTRQMLLELIEMHGSYELLGKCFAKDAPRKTDVEVAMITLKKPKLQSRFDFSNAGFSKSQSFEFTGDYNIKNVATQNAVTNLVAHYKEAENALIDIIQGFDKLAYHLGIFGAGRGGLTIQNIAKMICGFVDVNDKVVTPMKNKIFNDASDLVRERAWDYIDRRTHVGEALTNEARKQFCAYMEAQKGVDFSVENIEKLFQFLSLNSGFLMQKAIEQTFEMMCNFHYKNKVAPESWNKQNTEGFKTNSHFKVNPKVIIPYIIRATWSGSFPYIETSEQQKLDEIDKVLCHLFGLEMKNVVLISEALDLERAHRKREAITNAQSKGFDFETDYKNRLIFNPENFEGAKMIGDKEANNESNSWKNTTITRARGNIAESTFFWCEYFKKGTLHLYFKHRIVWETFNRVACEGKKQLG